VVSELNRRWTTGSVRTLLTNEKYIGNNVWNRKSTRLHRKRIPNPPSAWIRVDNASEPLVSRKLFNRAQAVAKARLSRISNEQMLVDLSKLLEMRGSLSGAIIDAAPHCGSSSLYKHRFGCLQVAYGLIGYEASLNYRYFDINNQLQLRRDEIVEDLLAAIRRVGGLVRYVPDSKLLRINEEFTVALSIARCRPSIYGYARWPLRNQSLCGADVSVLIRMKPDNVAVRDFLIAPAYEAQGAPPMLRANSGARLDTFLFQSLDVLVEMAQRSTIGALTWP